MVCLCVYVHIYIYLCVCVCVCVCVHAFVCVYPYFISRRIHIYSIVDSFADVEIQEYH